MLPVSAVWKEAVRAQFRRQAYLRMTIEVTPPDLREGATIFTEDTNKNSDQETIMDHLDTSPTGYFSLEPNRGILNGELKLLRRGSKTDQWWGNDYTGAAALKFTFDKAYSVPGIYFEWDLITHSFPATITVIAYGIDGIEKHRYSNIAITSERGFVDAEMVDVKSVDVIVNSWCNPKWLPRINEVLFGLYADFDSINAGRITSATVTNKSKPLSDSLPVYDVSVTLRNIDRYFDPALINGVSPYLARRQLAKYQWGFTVAPGVVEWTKEVPMYVKDFKIPEDSKDVTLNFTNRLSSLDRDFYLNTYTGQGRSVYDIALYILQNSRVIREFDDQIPWIIHDSMKSFITDAPIVKDKIPNILQLLALASCTWLSIDVPTGYIKFSVSKDGEADQLITENQELGDPSISVIDRVRSLNVAVYQYAEDTEKKEVGKGKYTLSGTSEVVIEYNVDYAKDVSAEVTGATLQSAVYYASYAILTLTAVLTGAEVEVTLTGREIVQNTSYIETFRDPTVSEGLDVIVDNPFVTRTDYLPVITAYALKYYNKRSRYTVNYTGYPEIEPVDKLSMKTVYGINDVDVTGAVIKFNGGWSGTLEVL